MKNRDKNEYECENTEATLIVSFVVKGVFLWLYFEISGKVLRLVLGPGSIELILVKANAKKSIIGGVTR